MKILAALICVLTSLQVAAEPSGLVRKLMSTETTMFEMGLLRLDRMLQRSDDLKQYSASYQWKTNQIQISRFILGRFDKEGKQIETFCSEGEELGCVSHIKKTLTKETRLLCMLYEGECTLGVSRHFGHRGFVRENFYGGKNDEEAVRQIDDITVAKISFMGATYIVNCEKYIKSEEVKCSSKRREEKK